MTACFKDRFIAAFFFTFLALLTVGCATEPATRNLVMTEYFLEKAGFQKWDVNDTTPKRQALLESIPREKIVTYRKDGETYHVYTDVGAKKLYVGDEVVYQKYLSITQGRKLCERVVAPDSTQFWSCYDEYQTLSGGRPRGQ
jgi:hypothetical protein